MCRRTNRSNVANATRWRSASRISPYGRMLFVFLLPLMLVNKDQYDSSDNYDMRPLKSTWYTRFWCAVSETVCSTRNDRQTSLTLTGRRWHSSLGYRVTTSLENLEMSGNLTAVREMSGNLTAVREMSGILLKIRELSGKNLVGEKLPKTVNCKLHICVHTDI